MEREVGGGWGWGTRVNPWLYHSNVGQNSLQIKKKKRQMLRLQSHQSSKQFSISVIKVGALLKMRDPLFKKHILFSCHVPGTVVDHLGR